MTANRERELRDAVFVDGVRTPFGKAGSLYAETRADDLVVNCIRELMRRHPELPPERVDEVAVAATASGIAFGAYDVVVAGGVEHMGHHPMGQGIDPNPRIVAEKLVDQSALVMGSPAENLHDRYPGITRQRADAYAVLSQERVRQAYVDGVIQESLVSVATRSTELGWGLATAD